MRVPRTERGIFDFVSQLTTKFLIKQLDKHNELSSTTQDRLEPDSGGTSDSLDLPDRSQSDRS